jgi:hypothetical protein
MKSNDAPKCNRRISQILSAGQAIPPKRQRRTMIERTEEALGLKPRRLTADTAYGTGKLLAWLLGKGIAPHIPVWERYQRTDGMFPRTDFAYDAERDVYICPNDRILRTSGTVHDGRVRNYLSQPGGPPLLTSKWMPTFTAWTASAPIHIAARANRFGVDAAVSVLDPAKKLAKLSLGDTVSQIGLAQHRRRPEPGWRCRRIAAAPSVAARRPHCSPAMKRGGLRLTSPICRTCCGRCEAGDCCRKAKLSYFSTAAQSELFDTESESDPVQSQ